MKLKIKLFLLFNAVFTIAFSQNTDLKKDNLIWTSQSKNSAESMPCGGGDIGLNVWVENGDLLFYIAKSGTFDENNSMLKLGRVRIKLFPNPFEGKTFKQELNIKHGNVEISGENGSLSSNIKVWVDVFRPAIHVEISSNQKIKLVVAYENWRYKDRDLHGLENNQNSWKWNPASNVKTYADQILPQKNSIRFVHQNKQKTVFDATVLEEGLESIKPQLFNPLRKLIFGGEILGNNLKFTGTYEGNYIDTDFKGWKLESISTTKNQKVDIILAVKTASDISDWQRALQQNIREANATEKIALSKTENWWKAYFDRSFIDINPENTDINSPQWQVGRNYQLFRYMLGCNAFGQYPTKFNGGLFTYDPGLVNKQFPFTPDFRNWGGGIFTAQNQRLVYWPMLKSGDFDLMKPQFDFYLRNLKNAELRTKTYWNHAGASFTEQIENYGLPNQAEYGQERPANFDPGLQYNAWLEYTWDTVFEFCQMILETERYGGKDITQYMQLIESSLTFYDEHYQYLAGLRGQKKLDTDGHLVLYPGSAGETFKMAYNATPTIAALKTVLTQMLELSEKYIDTGERKKLNAMLRRIPPISFREFDGHKTISPALHWERVNNEEPMQLYPVFPWGIYGVGKPDLNIALNTWKYDTIVIKFRSYIGWKQDNIFAARLGLVKEASDLTIAKMKDSGRRFPAFWGPGFDWTPDHNWGGSGMIGLQEMLMQTDGKKIFLFPAWPKNWNVHFKLFAPYQTTIEGIYKNGKVQLTKIFPKERERDLVLMNN